MSTKTRWPVCVLLFTSALLGACTQTTSGPEPGPVRDHARQSLSEEQQRQADRAATRAATGGYDAAANILEQLIEQRPHHPELWANLATLYHRLEKSELRDQALARARELNPDSIPALNLSGILALNADQPQSAERLFKRIVALESDYPDAHYNLALIYDTYYQDLERAIDHYQNYLALIEEPDDATTAWLEQLKNALKRQQHREHAG